MDHVLAEIALDQLVPHPRNTHGKISAKDVADLVASIKAVGQLDPLIVRLQPDDADRYQILAGHRRAVAAKEAGLEAVKAQIYALDDSHADAVLVLSNCDRENPDLFREAAAVKAILEERSGWKVSDVAGLLGKSPKFVATLRAIADLEPSVAKAMASEKCEWTPEMVAMFAALAPEVQKVKWTELTRRAYVRTAKELRDALDFRTVGSAPWDASDDTLVPKAGSCASCPKTSLRAPGLFDDGDLDPADPATLKKAVCRDSTCWATKALAHLKRRVEEVSVETGVAACLVTENAFGDQLARLRTIANVVDKWEVENAKKGEDGACPAIVVGGEDDGKVRWVRGAGVGEKSSRGKKSKGASATAEEIVESSAPEKKKALTVEERRERLESRRNAWIVDHVQEAVRNLSPARAPYALVRACVVAYGGHETRPFATGGLRDFSTPLMKDDAAWAEAAWPVVRQVVARGLARLGLDQVDEQVNDALFVAELMGADLPALWDKAAKEIPTPKGLEGEEKKLPAPKAKKSSKKKALAAAK